MKKIIIIGVILLVIAGIALLLISGTPPPPPTTRTLNIWGVFDEAEFYKDVIAAYQLQHPYVKIVYKKYRPEEYENLLITSWAQGIGPDIFLIPNYSLNKYKDYISPIPKETRMALYKKVKTLGIKEETKIEWVTTPSLTTKKLKDSFIDVASSDVVLDNQIYALPLYTDTLVLFYNKDLLFKAGFAEPPQTWEEFIKMVSKITSLDSSNNIVRAGAALGAYNNITRAFDIISLLMLQNGTQMTDATGKQITFQSSIGTDAAYSPSDEAVRFYTDFASPNKEVYTWNDQMPNAIDSFISGNLAFLIAYSYQKSNIDAQAPGLNYSISYFPQIGAGQMVNYANYWVMTVHKKSPYINDAWDFIQFAAKEQNVKSYLTQSNRVSVLRSILQKQLGEDPESTIYKLAKQALTAKSWYHGQDPQKADEYFKNMIESVNSGQATINEAVGLAAKLIQQTL